MAIFYGPIGVSDPSETTPGVFSNVVTERDVRGDMLRTSTRHKTSPSLVGDVSSGHRLSIIVDPDIEHIYTQVVYVVWKGVRWKVDSATFERPRVIFNLGGPYRGPTPAVS